MVILRNVPPPFSDPIARPKRKEFGDRPDPKEGLMTDTWQQYESGQNEVIDKTAVQIAKVFLDDQQVGVALGTTLKEVLSAGLYRVSYYLRLSVVDTVGSTVDIAFNWTWDGVARSKSYTGVAANTLTETASEHLLLKADANTDVQYSTTAAFFTGDGRYALDVVLEQMP